MEGEKYFVEKKKGMNLVAVILIAVIVAILSSVSTYLLIINKDKITGTKNGEGENTSSISTKYEIEKIQNPVIAVAKECKTSIVGISVEYITQNIFGMLQNASSGGSGIIYSKDGYILTNCHVVESALESSNAIITVTLLDGKEYKATIVGADDVTDIAVLKIDADNLNAAKWGDSSKVEVGEMAIVIGNPLGQTLAGSVTVGYISALNRKITTNGTTYNLIQTDAAINGGNSGGALLNAQGEVIGISTAKAASLGVEGLCFAIPIDDAKPIIEELMKNGKIERPYLGIGGFTLSKEMATRYNLVEGVYVQEVYDGGSIKKSGIKAGDIIVKIDDTEIKTFEDLNSYKNSKKIGDKITIEYFRNGKTEKVEIVLEGKE